MKYASTTKGGFTLIEVMVALAIVAVALVSIYGSFIGISDTIARVDNYNRSVLLGLQKMWEAEDDLLQSGEISVAHSSGELTDKHRSFKWEFQENDVDAKSYPNLKDVTMKFYWQEGNRSGNFQAGTYLKAVTPPK